MLIVHGNHNWREFSDPGYGYLGELLASRGFILASVDENFINGLSAENDGARLAAAEAPRGVEAVQRDRGRPVLPPRGHERTSRSWATRAAAKPRRSRRRSTDSSTTRTTSSRNSSSTSTIKAVVAIAPVDGQYKPTGQFTPLENVNYLLIHGSHDGDVSTAVGLRQYERLRFTDGQPWFKSVLFMYRANHGQWNTVWGNKDNGPRSGRSLDLRALIDPEAQRQFAKVVISGFLEATLHGKREYLPMFRDHRTAGAWLPKTMYTTRFQESGYHALAEFDDDVDLTTGHGPRRDARRRTSLDVERERACRSAAAATTRRITTRVWIGWNNRLAGTDADKADGRETDGATAREAGTTVRPADAAEAEEPKLKLGPPATYSISVPDALRSEWGIGERQRRVSVARGDEHEAGSAHAAARSEEGRRREAADKTGAEAKGHAETETAADAQAEPPKPKEEAGPDAGRSDRRARRTRPDTSRGCRSAASASRAIRSTRASTAAPAATRTRFTNIYELIPQTFVMPLADFAQDGAGVRSAPARDDPAGLRQDRGRHRRRRARRPVHAARGRRAGLAGQ